MKEFSDQESGSDEGKIGRWTYKEHQDFVKGVSFYGKDWKKIAEFLGTRTAVQVRSHAQKFYQREENIKKIKRKAQKLILKPIALNIDICAKRDKSTQYGEGIYFPGFDLNQQNEKLYFLY